MLYFFFAIHVLIALALVLVILSQTSKGGLDANFGSVAGGALGGSGASAFLNKWTKILGGMFLISCIWMAIYIKSDRSPKAPKSKIDWTQEAPAEATTEMPVAAPVETPAPTE
ncbi:MAG: preprotein translocase subunit SecG [Candidatus Zophobacter franzmannii]|jgi:protein translocase SecG subunit|nr:preprotein translocase subunit SecG [Candidatus Zophobacter franzmannii]